MILEHNAKTPSIESSAYIAPTATICGDVKIGMGSRIMHGACIIAEGGVIVIGANCIILENAVIRSTSRHSTSIGNNCLVGPNAHIVGSTIKNEVFIATGSSIFHGSYIGARSEVRINGIVHLKTVLGEESIVPIGWIAVGDPAVILSPNKHNEIWEIQKPLNFPLEAYGYDRSTATMEKITEEMSMLLGSHKNDIEIKNEL